MLELSKLREFNPAIIYCLEPEAAGHIPQDADHFPALLSYVIGQHHDLLQAYVFAQDVILPRFRKQAEISVTPAQFLSDIKMVHARLSRHLLEYAPQYSGNYTDEIILRWHNGAALNDEFVLYFSGRHFCRSYPDFAFFLCKEYDFKPTQIEAFVALLNRIKVDETIELKPSQRAKLLPPSSPRYAGALVLNKMHAAYYSGKLTIAEKQLINGIVKPCISPDDIPRAMDDFAIKTLESLSRCDRENPREIAHFLAQVFFEFTDIHPFVNGNGRTGWVLVNIFSRFFGLPSLLLRMPGEKSDASSPYARAIADIEDTRAPLEALITQGITAEMAKPFSDPKLEEEVNLRHSLCEIYQRIQRHHPRFNLAIIHNDKKVQAVERGNWPDRNTETIASLCERLRLAEFHEARLDEAVSASTLRLAPKLTSEQKEQILEKLHQITGIGGWKMNQRSGILVWLECSNKTEAQAIQDQLNSYKVSKVTLLKRVDDPLISVVKCEDIQLQKLLELPHALTEKDHGAALKV